MSKKQKIEWEVVDFEQNEINVLVLAFPFIKKNSYTDYHTIIIIDDNNSKITLPTESMIKKESQNIKDYGRVYYEFEKSNQIGWINDVYLGEYSHYYIKKMFSGFILNISFDKQKLKNIMSKNKLKSINDLRFNTSYFITFDVDKNYKKKLADYKFDNISITKKPIFNQCKIIKVF